MERVAFLLHRARAVVAVAVLGPDPVAGVFGPPVAHLLGVRAAGVGADVLPQPFALARAMAGPAAEGLGAVALFLRVLRERRRPVAAT